MPTRIPTKYRNQYQMPHYRRDDSPGATWFFTVVTYRRQEVLCNEAVRKSLREAIAVTRIHRPFQVDAWVLLPNHVHCLWTLPAEDTDFSTRWNLIKRRTSKALGDAYFRTVLGASNPGR